MGSLGRVAALLGLSAALASCGGDGDDGGVIEPVAADPAVEVRVTSHRDGARVRTTSVRLAGIVTPGSAVSVNGSRAATRPGGADEPDTFAVRLQLRRGRNVIEVTATKPGATPAVRTLVLVRSRARTREPRDDRPQDGSAGPGAQPEPNQGGPPAPAPRSTDPDQLAPPQPVAPEEDPDQLAPPQPAPPAPPPADPDQGGSPAPG